MSKIVKFTNCRLLRDSKLIVDDLWVRDGKILDPQNIFFDEQRVPDKIVDCSGQIVAPGFLDIQINGGYGIDFSYNTEQIEEGVALVAKHLIEHGVTGFCPTLVTSPSNMYRTILPRIKKSKGGKHGAAILGVHVEGPFISPQKKGAHPIECIKNFDGGFKSVEETYGYLEDIKIVTIAPEKENSKEIIKKLVEMDIVVSLGHSTADLNIGEIGCQNGARLITHLFNAMLPFHHRDPGLVGLLTSDKIQKPMYFGLISDGIHTHPAALRIAYRTHPEGLILVTDAISALGLNEGFHKLGQLAIEIRDKKAFISNTDTLCGSIATLNECVQIFHRETNCGIVYALEAASLHPAQVLQLKNKGTLNYGADADLIIVDDDLLVHSTWIDGECVFLRKKCCSN